MRLRLHLPVATGALMVGWMVLVAPTPAAAQPATPQPATARPATPRPATPQPATVRPATPRPATPRPVTVPSKKVTVLAGVKVTLVVSGTALRPSGKTLKPFFAITTEGPLVVSGANLRLPLVSKSLLKKVLPGLSGFAVVPSGLVAISGRSFGAVWRNVFVPKVRLPVSGMRIAAGGPGGTVYLYGRAGPGSSRGVVYRYWPGGRYQKLLGTSGPVRHLICAGKRLFFAVGKDIYTYKQGKGLARLYRSTSGHVIEGLAFDPKHSIVYFSAGRTVWGLRGPLVTYVVGNIAGDLRWHKGVLFVLDRKAVELHALRNTSTAIRSFYKRRPQPRPRPGPRPRP